MTRAWFRERREEGEDFPRLATIDTPSHHHTTTATTTTTNHQGPANRNPSVTCDLWIPCVNDVHSNVHVLTGGVGTSGVSGVMLQAEVTGLDPIFFVHHSQVKKALGDCFRR